jgi:cell wall-associated NlpC family hydrolase
MNGHRDLKCYGSIYAIPSSQARGSDPGAHPVTSATVALRDHDDRADSSRAVRAGSAGVVAATFALGAMTLFAAAGVAVTSAVDRVATTSRIVPSAIATAGIPAAYLALYQAAAARCPGLPWTVLAGIGQVESGQGRDAHTSAAGAVGVVQMLPATFEEYAQPVPPGGQRPPNPLDPVDEIYAAARDLCANGARGGADIRGALYAYNHTAAYVQQVLSYAASYAASYAGSSAPSASAVPIVPGLGAPTEAAAIAISYAFDQIGTPYVWGAETPGVGFDCSGLTQAAYAAAGVRIPRTSTAQWTALPHVPLGDLEPGDLVFFEPGEFSPGLPGHVGIYIGDGEMVDAPHTGTDVRIDELSGWPPPMGAARPSLREMWPKSSIVSAANS